MFDGVDLLKLDPEAMRQRRRHLQVIFQDPYSSLNPRERVGAIVREPLDLMTHEMPKSDREQRVRDLFGLVGLRQDQMALFPHQFSGGQRQRISIARALATNPRLIVCDEPVSALDVAIQAQILNLLRRLQDDHGLSFLFISHDLGVVQFICDDVAVMYLGQIVEFADRPSLFPSRAISGAACGGVIARPPQERRLCARGRGQRRPAEPAEHPAGLRLRVALSARPTEMPRGTAALGLPRRRLRRLSLAERLISFPKAVVANQLHR